MTPPGCSSASPSFTGFEQREPWGQGVEVPRGVPRRVPFPEAALTFSWTLPEGGTCSTGRGLSTRLGDECIDFLAQDLKLVMSLFYRLLRNNPCGVRITWNRKRATREVGT